MDGSRSKQEIVNSILQNRSQFDMDGDGNTTINDGILILRRVMNLPDFILARDMILPTGIGGYEIDGSRSAAEIRTAIEALM